MARGIYRLSAAEVRTKTKPGYFSDGGGLFRQVVQRITALLALGVELDALDQRAAADAFTAAELGIER
jgi:hypothetical protein